MKTIACTVLFLVLASSVCLAQGTAGKPSDVELTIYNQNFGLVKEQREMTLNQGINVISVEDVAARIEPNTVSFKSLTDPKGVVVREQNYQYDLIEPIAILNKSVGKKVVVRRTIDGQVEEITGTLLNPASVMAPQDQRGGFTGGSSDGLVLHQNGLVIQTDRGILMLPSLYTGAVNSIQVLELPEGLSPRPTLLWRLETSKPGAHRTEISYLTKHIRWEADYVAVVDALDKYVDLTGWVTLTNNSGTTYENAKLNLMAGDVHRVRPESRFKTLGYEADAFAGKAAPQFAEKSFFEYHLYTLQGRTTVKDKESKQITLLTAARIPAKRTYIYDGRKNWWQPWFYESYRPGEGYDTSTNKKVNVFVEVMNSKENNLGIPLPKGIVRVYKQEADANQHFVGEDEIDHTPKDEKVRLYLGDAFDIVGEHKRTNFRRISDREVEESFQNTLRNHKDAPVTVVAVEHLTGDWKITQSSHKGFKKDASTVEFPIDIPKDGEVVVTYTVRTKW